MTTESQGLRTPESTRQTEVNPQSWNTVSVLGGTNSRDISHGADTATQHLPSLIIDDATKNQPKPADTTSHPGEQPKPKPADNGPKPADGDQHVGNTTVKKDSSGKPKEYDNADYSLAKHDDGKWYYNQKGSSTYVEVDGNSIKMDDKGKVNYNESGFFGKDNQTLGNGSSGFLSSLTSAASHVENAVVEHPLDTFNKIAFMPAAALDAVAGTHTIKAIGEMEKGAANEVIHHPGEILKDVAIGAAIGALTVATGGGALVAIGIGAAAVAATELAKNKGDLGAVVNDAEAFGSTVAGWGKDFATVAGSGQHSQQEEAAAEQGLHQVGAFGAQTVAGIAGGMAGGAGAAAVGLEGSVPRLVGNVASKFKPPGESPADVTEPPPQQLPAAERQPVTEPIAKTTEPLENRGAFTLPNGKPIDPHSAGLMRSAGLTQDSYLYRVMDPKFLDMESGMVGPNPNSCALIYHPDTPPFKISLPGGEEVSMPLKSPAIDAGPGLNVARINPEGAYRLPEHVLIGIRLGDMLSASGRLYRDGSAGLEGAYYATFDGSVPFNFIN